MRLKIILSFLTLLSLAFLVPSDVFGAWYDTEWEYRNKITVSLNSVISNDLSDFPVLIKFTHNDLKQANESEGRDFVFTLSDGTTKLSHEIESYDNATGEIIAWVNFPTLAAASSADIYIYYKGNTVGFNSADVWNDDYVLVWHLNQTSDGTAGEFSDATGNGNDGRGGGGTKVGYSAGRIPHDTDGQIGAGQELKGPTTIGSGEGTGDIIWTNSVIQGMPSRDVTIELWVGDIVNGPDNENNWLYNDLVSFCTTHTNDANNKWSNHLNLWRSGNVKMQAVTDLYVSTTDPGHPVDNNNPASFTNWNHIVAVYNLKDADGTQGNSQLYINGVLVKEENRSGHLNRVIQTSDLRMVLGGDVDGENKNNCGRVNNELIGKVDELRISSGLRTADYAAASYHNQGNPSAYLTLATQENVDTTSPTTVITSGSGGGCADCTPPTLGVNKDGTRLVDDGFSYNGDAIDVEHFYTPFDLLTVEIGKENVVGLKIYENQGADSIQHIGLSFGLDKEQIFGEGLAIIEWDKVYGDEPKVTVTDPENILGDVRVVVDPNLVKCTDDSQSEQCMIFRIYHTFREGPDFRIFSTYIWDDERNGWQNYFNHGLNVVGESLNPPDVHTVFDRQGYLYTITVSGDREAVDGNGDNWYLDDDEFWKKEFFVKKPVPQGTPMAGYDRDHPYFTAYQNGQVILAESTIKAILGVDSIQAILPDYISGADTSDAYSDSRLDDVMTNKMKLEEIKAFEKMYAEYYGQNPYGKKFPFTEPDPISGFGGTVPLSESDSQE